MDSKTKLLTLFGKTGCGLLFSGAALKWPKAVNNISRSRWFTFGLFNCCNKNPWLNSPLFSPGTQRAKEEKKERNVLKCTESRNNDESGGLIYYFELKLESRAAIKLPYELALKHVVDHWMVRWTWAFFSPLPDVVLIDGIADFVAVAEVAAVRPIQMETSAQENHIKIRNKSGIVIWENISRTDWCCCCCCGEDDCGGSQMICSSWKKKNEHTNSILISKQQFSPKTMKMPKKLRNSIWCLPIFWMQSYLVVSFSLHRLVPLMDC